MNAETIACLNYVVHSLVIGAAAWLLVRFVIRDALRRCILANLAVLMCLYTPFNIGMEDLFPPQKPVPVWTPIRETFKADWRVSVAPASAAKTSTVIEARGWDVNDVVRGMRWVAWIIAAAVLMRLLAQTVRVQRWAWGLRFLSREETEVLCGSAPEFCGDAGRLESSRGLEHSRTLARVRVSEGDGTPCVAGWFFPVIAVPASAFETLTAREWGWLMRHEAEHLRLHDTVAALLQNIVRALLWWNPFVHALVEEYARAREEACDAAAVGEESEHTAYADFLLAWAEKPGAQQACVMPIAYSRPARRLKARLVAQMEARGVRKKAGALFVLAVVAFAIFAPMIAASFGIAAAAAQEAVKADKDDGAMRTRVYGVAPDFLSGGVVRSDPFAPGNATAAAVKGKTARQLLEQEGVTFPSGASAIYNPTTSQLIVRNSKANLAMMERVIDTLNQRSKMVHFNCKIVGSDQFFGRHGSILSADDFEMLFRSLARMRGIDVMTSPNVTTRFDQKAIAEVAHEVPPKKLQDGTLSGDPKFVGLRFEMYAKAPVKGKFTLETKFDLGLDPDSESRWLLKNEDAADWDKVCIYSVAGRAALASGETLLLHLPTSKGPVTAFITANTIDPRGGRAGSFSATARMAPPASQGRDVPDEKASKDSSEMVTRVYLVPVGFGDGKKPVEYLEGKGVVFPQGGSAELADGSLAVRNTRRNLDLIEQLLLKSMTASGDKGVSIKVDVHVIEVEDGTVLGEWNPEKSTWIREPGSAPLPIRQAPPEVRHVFSAAGVMTDAQWRTLLGGIKGKAGALMDALPGKSMKHDERAVFDMPAALGGGQLAVRPQITSSSGSLSVSLQFPDLIPAPKRLMTTQVQIWDGQTVAFSGIPSEKEKVFRVIFVTARLVYPADDVKK